MNLVIRLGFEENHSDIVYEHRVVNVGRPQRRLQHRPTETEGLVAKRTLL